MSRRQLQTQVDRIAKNANIKLVLDYQAGGWRLDNGENRHLSPRLPAKDFARWLDGFEAAVDELKRADVSQQ